MRTLREPGLPEALPPIPIFRNVPNKKIIKNGFCITGKSLTVSWGYANGVAAHNRMSAHIFTSFILFWLNERTSPLF